MPDATATLTPFDLTVEIGQTRTLFGLNFMVTKITGWDGGGAAFRRDATPRSNAHGQFSERGWRDARMVTVEGSAWGDTRAQAAAGVDLLAEFLADGRKGRLTVIDPDLGTRYAECYLTGSDDPQWDTETDFNFAFDLVCPDPRKYGEPVASSTGVPKDGGGLQYDLFAGAFAEARRNLVLDPRATKPMPQYLAAGAITAVASVSGNPDGITTANRVEYPAGQSSPGVQLITGLTAGRTYTVSAWVRHDPLGTGTSFAFAESGVQSAPAHAVTVGAWQRVSWTRTVAAGSGGTIGYRTGGATSSGGFLITGVQVEESAAVSDYFDGDTADTSDAEYSWVGTPNGSQSVQSLAQGAGGVLDYGIAGESGLVSFTNTGGADTAARLRVDGYAPGFRITEVNTGRVLEYDAVIPSGSFLTLNPRTGAVYLDGVTTADRSQNLVRRQWSTTPPRGTTTFLFESTGPNARLTIEGEPAHW